jgi:hypothetical protein
VGTRIRRLAAELRDLALSATDRAGYFPAMYHRETSTVADELERGTFRDAAAVEHLTETFAAMYVRAFRGEIPRPRCWQASWDVAGDDRRLVVQHLLLGINAHVNHDLPQAVVAVVDDGARPDALAHDFTVVNRTFAVTFRGVLRDLDRVTRWVNTAARVGGGRLFRFSLERARAQAWTAAQLLTPLDADGRRAYVAELDGLVTVVAGLVARPAPPVRALVGTVRRLEEQDHRLVTRALLGSGGSG